MVIVPEDTCFLLGRTCPMRGMGLHCPAPLPHQAKGRERRLGLLRRRTRAKPGKLPSILAARLSPWRIGDSCDHAVRLAGLVSGSLC